MIAVVDVETTGLVPRVHEIISFCILPLKLDFTVDESIPPFQTTVKPERPETATPKALEVNGHNIEELLATAPTRKESIQKFVDWHKLYVLGGDHKTIHPVGHNWSFDKAFLIEWLDPDRVYPEAFNTFFHYQARDSQAVAAYFLDRARIRGQALPYKSAALRTIAKTIGLPFSEIHDALGDCRLTADIYRAFLNA